MLFNCIYVNISHSLDYFTTAVMQCIEFHTLNSHLLLYKVQQSGYSSNIRTVFNGKVRTQSVETLQYVSEVTKKYVAGRLISRMAPWALTEMFYNTYLLLLSLGRIIYIASKRISVVWESDVIIRTFISTQGNRRELILCSMFYF